MADGTTRCEWEFPCDHERFGDRNVCACHLTMETLSTMDEPERAIAVAMVAAEVDGFDLGVGGHGELILREALATEVLDADA